MYIINFIVLHLTTKVNLKWRVINLQLNVIDLKCCVTNFKLNVVNLKWAVRPCNIW